MNQPLTLNSHYVILKLPLISHPSIPSKLPPPLSVLSSFSSTKQISSSLILLFSELNRPTHASFCLNWRPQSATALLSSFLTLLEQNRQPAALATRADPVLHQSFLHPQAWAASVELRGRINGGGPCAVALQEENRWDRKNGTQGEEITREYSWNKRCSSSIPCSKNVVLFTCTPRKLVKLAGSGQYYATWVYV